MGLVYEYRVRDKSGKMIKGTLEAESKQLVISKLREQGYIITSLQHKAQGKDVSDVFASIIGTRLQDLVIFSRQFATLINAGLPILKCLEILSKETTSRTLGEALSEMRRDVEGGNSLASAMSKFPRVFPELFVTMIGAGETGGVLDKTLERLAEHYEKEAELREKIKTATRYPMIVGFIAIGVVILMLAKVVPSFSQMFASMNLELPLATRVLLAISGIFVNYSAVLLVVCAVVGYAGYKYVHTEEGRVQWEAITEKMPVFGDLNLKINIARICRTLGTLMASGVPIIQALEVVKSLAGTVKVRQAMEDARSSISEGGGMASALEYNRVFPPMVSQMVAVGEETGNIDGMLIKVAEFYDKEVKNITERLSSLIEPLLIAFLAVVVGGIVVATILPMFQLYGKLGNL